MPGYPYVRGAGGTIRAPHLHFLDEESSRSIPLGSRLPIGERVFHYAEAGSTALAPGLLCQSLVPVADHTGLTVSTGGVAGDTKIIVTNGASTALVANDHQDGWFWVDTGTYSLGTAYKVHKNTAAAASAAATFTLRDELEQAIVAGTDTVSLAKNQYAELIVHPSVPTAHVVGVPLLDVTADYFFWLQTWGPAAIITEGTLVISDHAAIGDGTDGGVQPADTDTELIVGSVMRVEAAGEYSLVYLRLAP